MKSFKKILAIFLVLLTFFSLVACNGEYHEGNKPSTDNGGDEETGDGGTGDGYVPPVMNDDPSDDFTVTLMANGVSYKPRMDMYAYWNDGFSVHMAKFDDKGIAKIDGLDGDYRVTLSEIPNEFAYDPNNNYATNDDRNIVINMYTLNHMSDGGAGIYDCKSFRYTGVYSAVIEGPDDAIYFEYAPDGMGTYTIESWMDVTADNINPYIDVYGGHTEYKFFMEQTNDGGAMGSYTINFVHTVQIAKENISAGGQATYTFAIRADVKNNKYPVTIVFAVKRDGDFELVRPDNAGGTSKGTKLPEHDFSDFDINDHEYDNDYKIKNPEYQLSAGSNTYVLDERKFKIWSKDDGGDDFYHVYDKEKYPETDGYGPILYGYITKPTRFIDVAFSRIEYNASGEVINAALNAGGYNYKHFIEGYTALATMGNINGGTYYCNEGCPCHELSELEGWACPPSCNECLSSCRKCPEELIGFEGYQAYANSDGLVPVTEELKEFFQNYCTKEIFFYDGTGRFEREAVDGKLFQSVGESGWLFACAYYEK